MQVSERPIAYSYLRFSTGAQASGDSLVRQSSLAASYATKHDLWLDESVTFKDLGVSGFRGKNAHRGALAAFLRLVQQDKIKPGSYLLIESLDRLSRDHVLRAQAILTELVLAGVNVVSLIDQRLYSAETLSSDPIGLIYALLVFVRANEESKTKSLRARQNWVRKRETVATKAISRKTPFWVTVQDGVVQPIPERCSLVRRVFAMYRNGLTSCEIAATLNAASQIRWSVPEQQWTTAAISRLLSNRRTTGLLPLYTLSFKGRAAARVPHSAVKDYYPALIKPKAFLQAQIFIPDGKTRSARARYNSLALIGHCSECGHPLRLVTLSLDGQHALACQASRILYNCSAPELSYTALMKQVRPALREWITSDYLWQTQPANRASFRNMVKLLDDDRTTLQTSCADTPMCNERLLQLESTLEDALTYPIRGRKHVIETASSVCKYIDAIAVVPSQTIAINKLLRQIFSKVTVDLRTTACNFYDMHGHVAFTVNGSRL